MILDKFEIVTEFKHIQIREIMSDGGYHRRVLTPDMNVSSESDEIKALTAEHWTDAVKTAWAEKLKNED